MSGRSRTAGAKWPSNFCEGSAGVALRSPTHCASSEASVHPRPIARFFRRLDQSPHRPGLWRRRTRSTGPWDGSGTGWKRLSRSVWKPRRPRQSEPSRSALLNSPAGPFRASKQQTATAVRPDVKIEAGRDSSARGNPAPGLRFVPFPEARRPREGHGVPSPFDGNDKLWALSMGLAGPAVSAKTTFRRALDWRRVG